MSLENLDTALAFAAAMLLFSLMITTMVQMASDLCNIRGRYLLRGLTQLIASLDHGRLKGQARALAKDVLENAALSAPLAPEPSRRKWLKSWKLATAIRPEELIRILDDPALKNHLEANEKKSLDALYEPIIPPEAQNTLKSAPAGLATLIEKLQQGFPREIDKQVATWFNAVMDRTSERFKTWSRISAVIFALLLSFGLQIDSLALYKNLASDPTVRAQVLSLTETVSGEAEKIFTPDAGFAALTIRRLLDDKQFADGEVVTKLGEIPALNTRKEGEDWLLGRLSDSPLQKRFLDAYDKEYPQTVQAHFKELQASLEQVQKQVTETAPGLIPDAWEVSKYGDWRAWIGMLMTAAFLSLGAPFWYNALRNLSALKPVLASKLEAQEERGAPVANQ